MRRSSRAPCRFRSPRASRALARCGPPPNVRADFDASLHRPKHHGHSCAPFDSRRRRSAEKILEQYPAWLAASDGASMVREGTRARAAAKTPHLVAYATEVVAMGQCLQGDARSALATLGAMPRGFAPSLDVALHVLDAAGEHAAAARASSSRRGVVGRSRANVASKSALALRANLKITRGTASSNRFACTSRASREPFSAVRIFAFAISVAFLIRLAAVCRNALVDACDESHAVLIVAARGVLRAAARSEARVASRETSRERQRIALRLNRGHVLRILRVQHGRGVLNRFARVASEPLASLMTIPGILLGEIIARDFFRTRSPPKPAAK